MNTSAISSSSESTSSAINVNQKIHNDLQIVVDKMNGCESLMQSSKTASQELLAVVGFLEACQPRMIELVEAAAQGALSEQVLMEALQVNDRLTKILSDVDYQIDFDSNNTADPAAAPSEPEFTIQEEGGDEDLLLMEDFDNPLAPAVVATSAAATMDEPATGGPKTTGEDLDDLLDLDNEAAMDQLTLGDDDAGDKVTSTKSEDEFDEFLMGRSS
ncbi:hypothetical protein MPSEU_000775300 [Mayamaea pseudoterrestris]|nr:hypothetical protein MPSEU_000775300 [Mayamaea pseudoterrestris]